MEDFLLGAPCRWGQGLYKGVSILSVTGVLQLLTVTFCLDGGGQDQGYGG